MSLYGFLSTIAFIGLMLSGLRSEHQRLSFDNRCKNILKDTLPSLSTLRVEDIDTAVASYKEKTIAVKLMTGKLLKYSKSEWEPYARQDWNKKLEHAMGILTMTFTRAEYGPFFPGGEEEWNKYLK